MNEKILKHLNDYVDGFISLRSLHRTLCPIFMVDGEEEILRNEIGHRATDGLIEIFDSVSISIGDAESKMIEIPQSDLDHARGKILRFLASLAQAPNDPKLERNNANKKDYSLKPYISLKTLARMREMGISILDLDHATRHSNRIRKTIFFGLIYSDFFGKNWKYYDEEQDLFVIVDDGDVCAIARGRPNV